MGLASWTDTLSARSFRQRARGNPAVGSRLSQVRKRRCALESVVQARNAQASQLVLSTRCLPGEGKIAATGTSDRRHTCCLTDIVQWPLERARSGLCGQEAARPSMRRMRQLKMPTPSRYYIVVLAQRRHQGINKRAAKPSL